MDDKYADVSAPRSRLMMHVSRLIPREGELHLPPVTQPTPQLHLLEPLLSLSQQPTAASGTSHASPTQSTEHPLLTQQQM